MLLSHNNYFLFENNISKVLIIYKDVARKLLDVEIKFYNLDKESEYVRDVISNKNNEYFYDEDIIEFKYVILCFLKNIKKLKMTKGNVDDTSLISNFFSNSLRLRNRLWHPEFDKTNEKKIFCGVVKLMLCVFNLIEKSYENMKIIKEEYYQFLQLFLNEFEEDKNMNCISKKKLYIKEKFNYYNNFNEEVSKIDFSVLPLDNEIKKTYK